MTIFEELKARGLVFQTTDEEALKKRWMKDMSLFIQAMIQQRTASI